MANPEPPKKDQSGIEPMGAESKVPDLLLVVDELAHRYGVTPFQVMDWPYEGFLTLVDVVEESKRLEREAILESGIPMPDGSVLDPDTLDDSKIKVGPIPDLNPKVH